MEKEASVCIIPEVRDPADIIPADTVPVGIAPADTAPDTVPRPRHPCHRPCPADTRVTAVPTADAACWGSSRPWADG